MTKTRPPRALLREARRSGRRALAALALLGALTALAVVFWSEDRVTPTPPSATTSLIGTFDDGTLSAESWSVAGSSSSEVQLVADPVYRGSGALSVRSIDKSAARVIHAPTPIVAGNRYAAAALSLPADGTQRLVIEFLDPTWWVIHSAQVSTPQTNTWSQVSVTATAPTGSTSARVALASAPSPTQAVWDDVRFLSLELPNGGVESWSDGVPLGWSVTGSSGSAAERTAQAHSGQNALRLTGSNGESRVRTPFARVVPAVEHRFDSWIWTTSERQAIVSTWYDADLTPIRSTNHVVDAIPGRWTEAAFEDVAPSGAEFATMTLQGPSHPTGEVVWDDAGIAPQQAPHDETFRRTTVSTLDGFLTTTAPRIVTLSGRAKLVTVVSGNPATVQMVDVASGRLEHREQIPGLTNGWALTVGSDGHTLFLSGDQGHLLQFDAASKVLTDLGRATPNALQVFGLARGVDGKIWGASYPEGEVWNYDPGTSRFTSLGSAEPGAQYAHSIAVDAEHVYVGVGPIRPKIIAIRLDDPGSRSVIMPPIPVPQGFISELAAQGDLIAARFPGDRYGLFDLRTKSWREGADPSGAVNTQFPSVSLTDRPFLYLSRGRVWKVSAAGTGGPATIEVAETDLGPSLRSTVVGTSIDGVPGAWLVTHDGETTLRAINLSTILKPKDAPAATEHSQTFSLDLKPAALRVKSLAAGNDGLVYVGGFGGPSLAAFTPDGELMTRYPRRGDPSRGVIGEIEGMVARGPFQFLGSYTGARILRYDTSRPWDDGTNPEQVASLGSIQQDRPAAWAVSGDRAYFGTVPKYGLLGGALGWVDGTADAATVRRSPVNDQSIVSLAAQGHILFAGTSRWGGLAATPKAHSAVAFAYDTDTRKVLWTLSPDDHPQSISSLLLSTTGQLWAVSGTHLLQLDPTSGVPIRDFRLWQGTSTDGPTYSSTQMTEVNGLIFVAGFGGLYGVDPRTLRVVAVQAHGVAPSKVTSLNGDLFYPMLSRLVRAAS